MIKMRSIWTDKMYWELAKELGQLHDPDSDMRIFPTIRDGLIFAACLGYQIDTTATLDKNSESEDVQVNVWEQNNDDALINLIGIGKTKSLDILQDDNDLDQCRIFEDYIHGGLSKIKLWQIDNPGNLFDAILLGLHKETILPEDEQIVDTPIEF